VVPADEPRPHPLKVRQGHVDLDGLGPGDVGVREDEPVLGEDDARTYAGVDLASPFVEVEAANVDADDRVEQALEAPAHGRSPGWGQRPQDEWDGQD
jgi:hypothetical protein